MKTREQWLEERKNHIGASDCAAILGADPRRGGLAVYESKVTGYSQPDNDWMRFGRDVEMAISNLYEAKTGRSTIDGGATTIEYHPDCTFIGATLDRRTWGSEENPAPFDPVIGPLELKHVGDFSRSKEWAENPPLNYQIQLQIQMACTGATWGCLAGMFPGYQLAWVDIERDDDFLEAAYPILERFWKRVQDRDQPPVDSHRDLEVIKRLHPAESGETVALDAEWMNVANDWERAKEAEKLAKNEKKEIEARIRAEMGDATFGALHDGTSLTLKTTNRKARTTTVAASTFRTLRRTRMKGE